MIITSVKETLRGFEATISIPADKDGLIRLGHHTYCTIEEAKNAIKDCILCLDIENGTVILKPKES